MAPEPVTTGESVPLASSRTPAPSVGVGVGGKRTATINTTNDSGVIGSVGEGGGEDEDRSEHTTSDEKRMNVTADVVM